MARSLVTYQHQVRKLHPFIKEKHPNAVCLETVAVSRPVVEQLEAIADGVVAEASWFEVTAGRLVHLSALISVLKVDFQIKDVCKYKTPNVVVHLRTRKYFSHLHVFLKEFRLVVMFRFDSAFGLDTITLAARGKQLCFCSLWSTLYIHAADHP